MKNIISNTIYAATLCVFGTCNLNAQQVGSFDGTNNAGWFVGNNQNYYSQFRMQTGPNSIFSLSNYGDRFGVFFQNNNYNSDGTFSYSSVTAQTEDLFTILKTGNVGIGTTTPTSKLHVNGNVRIETGLSMGGSSFFNIDAPNIVGGRMTVLPSGNVGINTPTPTAKLEINGDTRMSSQLRFRNGSLNSMNNAKGIIWGDGSYNNNYSRIDDDSNLRLLTDDNFYVGYLKGDGTAGGTTLYADVTKCKVGIGTVNPTSTLSVNGTVTALNYALVTASNMPDYVFEADYKLKTLAETEAYIKENKHLPAFKSAKHYEKEGYTITEMNIALEQTVEELTLHAIAQEKEINAMKNELADIKALLLSKK